MNPSIYDPTFSVGSLEWRGYGVMPSEKREIE